MDIIEILSQIQTEIKAPKSQFNSFGKYHYRSLEDINEAIKPLLEKYKASLILNDDIVLLADRFYIKATATLRKGEQSISATGYARESLEKKGMDASQATGSASSYARKYALNGLLALDDTKDADSNELREQTQSKNNAEQIADLQAYISLTQTDLRVFLDAFKVNDLALVPYEKAKSQLLAKLNKMKRSAN